MRAIAARPVRPTAEKGVGDLGDGPRARLEVDTLPWDQARGQAAMQSARWTSIPRTPPDRAWPNLPATLGAPRSKPQAENRKARRANFGKWGG